MCVVALKSTFVIGSGLIDAEEGERMSARFRRREDGDGRELWLLLFSLVSSAILAVVALPSHRHATRRFLYYLFSSSSFSLVASRGVYRYAHVALFFFFFFFCCYFRSRVCLFLLVCSVE